MENWLNEIELKGEMVTLLPMRTEHGALLAEAAADGHLWGLWYTSVPDSSSVDKYIKDALIEKQKGTALPISFVSNLPLCLPFLPTLSNSAIMLPLFLNLSLVR